MRLTRHSFATISILCLGLAGHVASLAADESARHTFIIGTNDFLLDDPGAFSKPVNLKFTGRLLRPDLKTGGGELMEFICLEGNEYGSAAGFKPGQGTSIK